MVKQMLENAVSKYPKLDGRFPMISGFRFTFSPGNEVGNRVQPEDIRDMNEEPLDLRKSYIVAMLEFMAKGGDGFHFLNEKVSGVEIVVEPEAAPVLPHLVTRCFQTIGPELDLSVEQLRVRKERLKMYQTNKYNKTDKGFIRINPQLDGRIQLKN
jgi:hypothetical protein